MNPNEPIDLAGCIAGQKPEWDRFVQRFAGVIYAAVQRTLARHGGGGPSIDDIAQDVFLRIIRDDYRLLRTYDPSKAALTTWLTLIARSITIDAMRAHRPTVPLDERRHDRGTSPVEVVAESSILPPMPDGLLSPSQKQVLSLLFDHDLSVEEAAARMRVDPQTIRSAKHKALTKLRQYFGRGSPP